MKNRRAFKRLVPAALAATLIFSCNNGKNNGQKEEPAEAPDTVKTTVLNVGGELFSVPSPIQTALAVQKLGIPYDKSSLSASNKVNTFSTDFSRALNLGIYGADLGYVSLYNQTQDALGYLAAIKQLTDKLGLSSAFDPPTMERIRNNIANKDSMMTIVALAYRAGDAYLKNNSRSDVSSLILAGGWIESMHFSVSAYKVKQDAQIRYRIAEQKQGLNSLLKILSTMNSEQASALTAQLKGLAAIYDEIVFTYTYAEPKTDTAKKLTYINSTTEVTVTEDHIERISRKVEEIRDGIIKVTEG
jgi:hypothetical protein